MPIGLDQPSIDSSLGRVPLVPGGLMDKRINWQKEEENIGVFWREEDTSYYQPAQLPIGERT